jgi:co-chaperonin GroES (HSP10)
MPIRPLGNNVILAPVSKTQVLPFGLVLPPNHVDPHSFKQYRVMAIGPGKRQKNGTCRPIEVEVGNHVLAQGTYDHGTLPDGCKVMDASEIIATWGPG